MNNNSTKFLTAENEVGKRLDILLAKKISDLSRSNWCPATVTPPYFIPLQLNPGEHTIQVVIDQGDDEGSSFNHWGVTGILTGEFSN